MSLIEDYRMIGFNHHQSDFQMRGAVSLHGKRGSGFLNHARPLGFTGFVLSTCNRTEIYFRGITELEVLQSWRTQCPQAIFSKDYLIQLSGMDMLNHLYAVACGLDAKVPGDNEILGQLKIAINEAREAKLLPGIWQKITNSAIACSRKVRDATNFNRGATSIPYTISKQIRSRFGLSPNILILGTGEMASLCIKYINKHLPERRLAIASRCPEKARRAATEGGGYAVLLPEPNAGFSGYDVVIAALQLDHHQFEIPQQHTLVFDLGIPANFHPGTSSGRYFHLDRLATGVKITLGCRSREVEKVNRIIREQLDGWSAWEAGRKRNTKYLNLTACSPSA